MSFIPWSDDYLVHVRVIDNDHKALFEIVNSLHDSVTTNACTTQISSTLKALQDYVAQHFAREELYMKEAGYPNFEGHVTKHNNLKGTVQGLIDFYNTDPSKVDTDKLLSFLRDWLINHILKSDMAYVPYLLGKKEGCQVVKSGKSSSAPSGKPVRSLMIKVPTGDADVIAKIAAALFEDNDKAKEIRALAAKLGD